MMNFPLEFVYCHLFLSAFIFIYSQKCFCHMKCLDSGNVISMSETRRFLSTAAKYHDSVRYTLTMARACSCLCVSNIGSQMQNTLRKNPSIGPSWNKRILQVNTSIFSHRSSQDNKLNNFINNSKIPYQVSILHGPV